MAVVSKAVLALQQRILMFSLEDKVAGAVQGITLALAVLVLLELSRVEEVEAVGAVHPLAAQEAQVGPARAEFGIGRNNKNRSRND